MRTRIPVPTLLFILLSCQTGLTTAQSTADELLKQALDLLASEKAPEALRVVSEFKQQYPQDARGPYVAGMALGLLERFAEAAVEFDQAIQMDPANLEYRLKAALAHDRLGRIAQAIERLQVVDGDNLAFASSGDALWLLSDLYFRQNRAPDAERVLNRYRELNPADFRAQMRLGQIDLIEGRFEAALSRFLEVQGLAPDAAPVHHAVGLAHWRLNHNDDALVALQRSVSIEPNNPGFRLDLGRFLVETGQAEAGLEELKKAQSLDPENSDVDLLLARAYRAVGDVESAAAAVEKVQANRSPGTDETSTSRRSESKIVTVAQLLAEGKVDDAHAILVEVVEDDPDHLVAHNYLAKIYISSGLFDAASQHLNELRRLAPGSFDVEYLTASFYYRGRDLEKALASGLVARESRPDYADLRNMLGNIYFDLGEHDLARAEYEAAVKLAPDRTEFQRNLRSVSKPD